MRASEPPEKLVDGGPEQLRARRLVEARERASARTSRSAVSNWMRKIRSSPDSRIARREDQRIVDVQRHAVVGRRRMAS